MATPRKIAKNSWRLDSCYKRNRKTFRGSSKQEVERMEREWIREIDDFGGTLSNAKTNFIELCKQNLLINVKDNVKQSSFARYMHVYSKHIETYNGFDKDVKDISSDDVKRFLNSKKSMAKSTVNQLKSLVYNALEYAKRLELVRENKSIGVKPPKNEYESKKEISFFTVEEQNKYMDRIIHLPYYELITVAFNTGMRQGELLALKWSNVDLDNNIIRVRETTDIIRVYDNDGNKTGRNFTKLPVLD